MNCGQACMGDYAGERKGRGVRMETFIVLYRYELKKIIGRKLVWATLAVCILCIIMAVSGGLFGTYYVDGKAVDTHYHMFLVDREYRKALSGRAVAQDLLEEMTDAYGKIPAMAERYTLTEEYQTWARPYSEIFNLVWSWTGENPLYNGWTADERELYGARAKLLEDTWRTLFLSEAEKEFWRGKEEQLDTPFIYYYHDGYFSVLKDFEVVGLLTLLFTAICLSGVFMEEHVRRTDQMILSGAKGKGIVYWVKILAGISVSAVCAALLAAAAVVGALAVYGTEGFHVSMQLVMETCSAPMTVGQACLTAYGILLLTAAFVSVMVMVCSEMLHSSIATLGLSTGLIVLGQMFRIPNQYRMAAQIWQSLPMCFLSVEGVFDPRLVRLGEHFFTAWQAAPFIYLVCGFVAAVAGKRVYERYQVSGR